LVDFSFPIDGFISILDYLGTAAFAITGASKAIAHKTDIFGIIVLATVVGVAGGITRDVIFGRFPTAFSDPVYIGITVIVGITMFFLYSYFKKRMNIWLVFDAIGLGVFSIIGASIAYQIVGLDFLPIMFGGVITAIGGGILRDVFCQRDSNSFCQRSICYCKHNWYCNFLRNSLLWRRYASCINHWNCFIYWNKITCNEV